MVGFKINFLLLSVAFICSVSYVSSMNEAQMKSAMKLIRNMCQPKMKVTNAQIDAMHQGVFPDDEKLKCYMSCALHSLKFMKNGKIDYEFAKGEVKRSPPSLQASIAKSIDDCKDSTVSDDKCEAAYQLAQCMYNSDPKSYFLP